MVVYRTRVQQPNRRNRVDHLNPQTMDHMMVTGRGDDDDDDDDRKGGGKKGRGGDDD
jgi:hypothetical protein